MFITLSPLSDTLLTSVSGSSSVFLFLSFRTFSFVSIFSEFVSVY